MDHRVKVAGIAFWSLFFINALVGTYVVVQYVTQTPIFGEVPTIFLGVVNGVVCLIAAIGMSVSEPYRL